MTEYQMNIREVLAKIYNGDKSDWKPRLEKLLVIVVELEHETLLAVSLLHAAVDLCEQGADTCDWETRVTAAFGGALKLSLGLRVFLAILAFYRTGKNANTLLCLAAEERAIAWRALEEPREVKP